MTTTPPPLTPSELADLKAKAKAEVIRPLGGLTLWPPETILRLMDMVERRDEQIDTAHDALLAAQDALTNPGISAAIALQVIREALASTEPQT